VAGVAISVAMWVSGLTPSTRAVADGEARFNRSVLPAGP
jgi:hypothetical protein